MMNQGREQRPVCLERWRQWGQGMVPDKIEKSCAGDGLQFQFNAEKDEKFLHGSKRWTANKFMKLESSPTEFFLTSYLYVWNNILRHTIRCS